MITIDSHSGIYVLQTEQVLSISMDRAWDFFSAPRNLAKITPRYMGFHITSNVSDKMFHGQIITYRIGLIPGVKTNWVTEITHVREGTYFVDEQRFGPYAMWHHEHWFRPHPEGVHMLDRVSYRLPFGCMGRMTSPFIKSQLYKIFGYRRERLARPETFEDDFTAT